MVFQINQNIVGIRDILIHGAPNIGKHLGNFRILLVFEGRQVRNVTVARTIEILCQHIHDIISHISAISFVIAHGSINPVKGVFKTFAFREEVFADYLSFGVYIVARGSQHHEAKPANHIFYIEFHDSEIRKWYLR